jgi:hypothetical protein
MKNEREREESEEKTESSKREITHPSMAFPHSLTRSCLHIPHTNGLVIRARHDPTTIRQGTDSRDPLMKNGREEREGSEGMKQTGDRIKEEGRSLTLPWPSNTRSQDPVSTSHTRTVLSPDPDTTRRPSGKAQTLVTL